MSQIYVIFVSVWPFLLLWICYVASGDAHNKTVMEFQSKGVFDLTFWHVLDLDEKVKVKAVTRFTT